MCEGDKCIQENLVTHPSCFICFIDPLIAHGDSELTKTSTFEAIYVEYKTILSNLYHVEFYNFVD